MFSFLQNRIKAGITKKCKNLKFAQSGYWYVFCSKSWATNEYLSKIDITGYGGGANSFTWPACPKGCPHFSPSENMIESLDEGENVDESIAFNGNDCAIKSITFPDKITAGWLWNNIPNNIWFVLIVTILASFWAGFHAGKNDTIVKIIELISQHAAQGP